MWIGLLIVLFAVALAFTNGANDNSKGVATLIGGGLLSRKRAISFARGLNDTPKVAALIGALSWIMLNP